ncbi:MULTISPECIES: hypothetical protein [unclassified Bartonella]|uniref:hypothetical protein n=1 Tax=unclassified Bartonella TaxID=2645622 RepID=UPI00235E9507|nr:MULTISPECIES: hypothetical protein [unclassified Bartonella]
MTINQQHNKPQQESFQAQGNAQTASHATFAKGSKLFTFKEAMMLSMRDYKIIFCIAIVLLLLGALRAVYLPMFFFGLFIGGVYTGGGGFIDFLVFLPALLWGLSVIFLPVVLVLHYILDRRLKNMFEKLEQKASQQQKKSGTA